MNSNPQERPPARLLGLQFLLVGAMVNQWSLAFLFAGDEFIESREKLLPIWCFQGLAAVVGLLFLAGWSPTRLAKGARTALLPLALLVWAVALTLSGS